MFDTIMYPLKLVVAWIMVSFHTVLTRLGMPGDSGWTWGLSIVGLVIVIRIILIPLFVKQINASRGMQLVQPEIKKIQDKYKGKTDQASREAMGRETMEVYKRTGTNPFASCMPILLQSPIFFALFTVLNGISQGHTVGPLTADLVAEVDRANIFGARLSDTFTSADTMATQIVTIGLIVLMSLTTFTTQRQLMTKNMPAAALDNPMAQQQKMLMYIMPLVFAVSGVNFPIGVLIYWGTTNLWTMGQQFYVIRQMPAPGSQAEKDLQARRAKRGKSPFTGKSIAAPATAGAETTTEAETKISGQRQQPKRKNRNKRSGARTPGRGVDSATGTLGAATTEES